MRITLDIDDDVLTAAKERAARERTSIGAIVSRLARDSLTGHLPASRSRKRSAGRFALLPRRGEVVTLRNVRRMQGDETI